MEKLLGHLAWFASFWQQGELLCTQGLAYLLEDPEGERALTDFVTSAAGQTVSLGLTWQAECRQGDQRRPDLEGRNAAGKPVIKIEAKLGASFGDGQLQSYVSAFAAAEQGGVLLVVVPMARLEGAVGYVSEHFRVAGPGPWQVMREPVVVSCAVVAWEHLLTELSKVQSRGFQDDLAQFGAMYRVFVGDTVGPTSVQELKRWREQQGWWEVLVDRVTRELSTREGRVLPFGVDGGEHVYWRRYVCRRVSGEESCYSIGTMDPFEGYQTPLWLRFHGGTGHFKEIVGRLERSSLATKALRSGKHLWFPLEVPLESDSPEIIQVLIEQVREILAVAYPPVALPESDATNETLGDTAGRARREPGLRSASSLTSGAASQPAHADS